MKIAYMAAGAAGMYCGSCLHDNTLAAALLRLGEEVLLIPTYTPLRTDEEDMSYGRVFYGGINVFLQQKSSLFRHTPWWLDGLMDSPALLNRVSKRASSVDPASLGDLTVSMLQGELGNQKKELDKLVHWLRSDVKPDVIHLSNVMLLGMARQLSQQVGVPVVCSLSGEDIFLEKLTPPYYEQTRQLLKERAKDVSLFVSLNHYFAQFMSEYMEVDRNRIRIIPHGLQLAGHGTRSKAEGETAVVIGYLSRICHDKGLHVLAEAFKLLCQDPSLPPLKLKVAGYLGEADKPYLNQIEAGLREAGLIDRYEYAGEPDREGKIEFMQSLDMMSVPTIYRESKGISILEALVNAVPVVLPDHGTFPEMIEDTGGGLLCSPDDPASLAEQLATLVRDPALAQQHGRAAQKVVRGRYSAQIMAQRTQDLYRRLLI